MGIADENYIPFGDEWEKHVMKHSKKELVSMYKEVCIEKISLQKDYDNLSKQKSDKGHVVCAAGNSQLLFDVIKVSELKPGNGQGSVIAFIPKVGFVGCKYYSGTDSWIAMNSGDIVYPTEWLKKV